MLEVKDNTITFTSNQENTIHLEWEAHAFVSHLNQAYKKKFNNNNNNKIVEDLKKATAETINLIAPELNKHSENKTNNKLDFEISKKALNSINKIQNLSDNIKKSLNIQPSFFQKIINFFKNLVSTEIENLQQQNPLKYQDLISNLQNELPEVKNKILDQLRPEINSYLTKQWFKQLDTTTKQTIKSLQNKHKTERIFASFIITSLIASIGASLYFPQLIITGSIITPIIIASLTTLILSSIVFKLLEKSDKKIRYGTTTFTLLLCTALSLSLFFPIINIINIEILITIFATGIAIGYGLYNYTVPKDYSQMKKIFKTTSAYNETIEYKNTDTNVSITIQNPNPKLNSHNKNQWGEKTAKRPVEYKQIIEIDSKNNIEYKREFIRTPSLANTKAKANVDIPQIKKRLFDIFENNGGTYNLLTSIYPSFLNPFAWEDNTKNKQTISAERIFKAAHQYNRDSKTVSTLFIQNIGSNYHTEPLNNHPEACLLADMALLNTLNPTESFTEYQNFLKNPKAGDILHKTKYGKELRANINKSFDELAIKLEEKDEAKLSTKIRNALSLIVKKRMHYKPAFGNITQVLSIFLQTEKEQRTAFGCKSGNERFVDVANKVLLLFEADRLDKYSAKDTLIKQLDSFIKEKNETALDALDKTLADLCSKHNVAGPMNLITNSDNGANSKLKKIKNKSLIPKIETCARITLCLAIATLLDIIITGIIESGLFSLASFTALNPITIAICALLTLSIIATATMKLKPEWTKEIIITTGLLLISAIVILAISNSFVTLFTALSAATIITICLAALTFIFGLITAFNHNVINTNCGTNTTIASKNASMFQSHKAYNFVTKIFESYNTADNNNNQQTPSM